MEMQQHSGWSFSEKAEKNASLFQRFCEKMNVRTQVKRFLNNQALSKFFLAVLDPIRKKVSVFWTEILSQLRDEGIVKAQVLGKNDSFYSDDQRKEEDNEAIDNL